jgi:dCMP deaminase
VAKDLSSRSLCSRSTVGAIIVSADNATTWVGYNGPPAGFDHGNKDCRAWCPRAQLMGRYSPTYEDCPAIHAEANALLKFNRETGRGGLIYVNSDMCMGCAKLVANSGLRGVVVGRDPTTDSSHRSPDRVYDFLKTCGLEVHIVTR